MWPTEGHKDTTVYIRLEAPRRHHLTLRHVFHLPQVGDVTVTPGDIKRILGVLAIRRPVSVGALPSNEVAHREAAMVFMGLDR